MRAKYRDFGLLMPQKWRRRLFRLSPLDATHFTDKLTSHHTINKMACAARYSDDARRKRFDRMMHQEWYALEDFDLFWRQHAVDSDSGDNCADFAVEE
ncbi:hypothetical protein ACJ2_04280 [Pantoea sp. QMID2]|nr:hypothetical protein ACJ3_04290 [Pantoea sp. QMID3]GME50168.1 hypothetical protein ACJ4_04290 [Pantoea sp. QMID4]GME51439.1 hypothetical protein ACJ2_04280 [Pantoea sp. QMID2]